MMRKLSDQEFLLLSIGAFTLGVMFSITVLIVAISAF